MRSYRWMMSIGGMLVVAVIGSGDQLHAALIAEWLGNGNTNESVAGRNGTLINGAGFGSGQFGQQAFQFNGVNQSLSVDDDSVWDFGSNQFTIALWLNFDSISNRDFWGGGNMLIGHDEGPGEQNKWSFTYLADGHLDFHINSQNIGPIFLNSPIQSPVAVGEWNHFAVTKSGNTYTFFINAVSLGSVTDDHAIPDANAPLSIGQVEGIGFLDGRMQSIQIYDHALSQQELTTLRQPAVVPEPSTLAMCSVFGLLGGAAGWRRMRCAA